MTGRYRVWPAVAVAAAGALGAASVVISAAATDGGCPTGQDWVSVSPYTASDAPAGAVMAGYEQRLEPLLRACLDLDELPAVDVPDPRS